jgi:Na+-transporting NADH:ubiquinone oxidoreductase subunit A
VNRHEYAKLAIFAPFFQESSAMHILQRVFPRFLTVFSVLLFAAPAFGQGQGSSNVTVIAILVIIGALILVSAVLTLSENLIQIEAKKSGLDTQKSDLSIFPSLSNLWRKSPPPYTGGEELTDTSKGFDILLNGEAKNELLDVNLTRFAVRPPDFRGLAPIPKVVVKEGDEVKAGDVLFHDKKDLRIKYVAPVSGEVVEVRRGAKRSISEVIVLSDKKIKHRQFEPPSINESSREDIVEFLCETGGWTLINQRPFDVLPDPEDIPKGIFISTFDTAPIAPDQNWIIDGKEKLFQYGLDVLCKLTEGSVNLGLSANDDETAPHTAFMEATGVQKHWFRGKHPIGNVGVQIHHIDAIKPGQKVWTLGVQEVITLGELMHKGIYNPERIVAVTGARVENPGYVKTYAGANIGELLADNIIEGENRIISGDVLSGEQKYMDDFLGFRADQLTVIEEGNYFETFGWLLPLKPRPSISNTFPNFLFPSLKFDGDTNTHGEKRAFVVTGEYEKVLPMNLYLQHLIKAIMVGDIEEMEGLGLTELTEEDVAICEFVCTSKMPLQKLLREGLDFMREQS